MKDAVRLVGEELIVECSPRERVNGHCPADREAGGTNTQDERDATESNDGVYDSAVIYPVSPHRANVAEGHHDTGSRRREDGPIWHGSAVWGGARWVRG